jgi:pyrroline-5-carboxylate reductase
MTLKNRKIAFIGGGQITEIIVSNLTARKILPAQQLFVSDLAKDKLNKLHRKYKITILKDNTEAVSRGDFVFINVPPQAVSQVIQELSQPSFPEDTLLVTLAAGVLMDRFKRIGAKIPIVRALPNPPSQIGRGITALTFNSRVSEPLRDDIIELFSSMGDCVLLNESSLNAVTALSSPVITYMFFQALIDAGIRAGIDRTTATRIAYHTIVGAMELWHQRKVAPFELMAEASTPGGVSAESLFTLDKYAFRAAINEAVYRGTLKAAEFSQS